MFVFDRSAFAVVLPLALLVAAVLWSNRGQPVAPRQDQSTSASADARGDHQAIAANLPSR
jgi:hypothetical protein